MVALGMVVLRLVVLGLVQILYILLLWARSYIPLWLFVHCSRMLYNFHCDIANRREYIGTNVPHSCQSISCYYFVQSKSVTNFTAVFMILNIFIFMLLNVCEITVYIHFRKYFILQQIFSFQSPHKSSWLMRISACDGKNLFSWEFCQILVFGGFLRIDSWQSLENASQRSILHLCSASEF